MVRVKAAGVNPVDTYQRAGIFGKISMPFIPGLDAAGTVHTVGKNVSNFKVKAILSAICPLEYTQANAITNS